MKTVRQFRVTLKRRQTSSFNFLVMSMESMESAMIKLWTIPALQIAKITMIAQMVRMVVAAQKVAVTTLEKLISPRFKIILILGMLLTQSVQNHSIL